MATSLAVPRVVLAFAVSRFELGTTAHAETCDTATKCTWHLVLGTVPPEGLGGVTIEKLGCASLTLKVVRDDEEDESRDGTDRLGDGAVAVPHPVGSPFVLDKWFPRGRPGSAHMTARIKAEQVTTKPLQQWYRQRVHEA